MKKEGKEFDGIVIFLVNIYLEGMTSKNFPANIFTTSTASISNQGIHQPDQTSCQEKWLTRKTVSNSLEVIQVVIWSFFWFLHGCCCSLVGAFVLGFMSPHS
jgi:hypothetical protein